MRENMRNIGNMGKMPCHNYVLHRLNAKENIHFFDDPLLITHLSRTKFLEGDHVFKFP